MGWEGEVRTLGSQNPRNSPARQSEALGETVDDEDVILVDVLDVLSGRDGGAIAGAGVVVTRVELVADEGGAAAANVLDLGQLGVGDDSTGGVARVGGEDDGGAAGDLFCNLVGVDVVTVFLLQRDGDGGKLGGLVSGSWLRGRRRVAVLDRRF